MANNSRFDEEGKLRPGVIRPTYARFSSWPDHQPPTSGVDNAGNRWRGASRIVDRPKRKRRNKLTWRAELRRARQTAIAAKRAAAEEDG